jgi:hypothetical protein
VWLHQSSPAVGGNRFHPTRWSVELLSAQIQALGSEDTFADIRKLYWYLLYTFIWHRDYLPKDEQNLFFLHLIEHEILSRVDGSKSKFPPFLLASLQNHLSEEAYRARLLKRGGNAEFIHLDLQNAEDRYQLMS